MQTEDNDEIEAITLQELKKIESDEILWRYNSKSEKTRIEKTACHDFGEDDILNFIEKKEIKSTEWRNVLKFYFGFLALLSLICFYDILTLESKIETPIIYLSVFLGLLFILLILILLIKPKNEVVFTITQNGLLKDDRLFEWHNTQFFDFSKKGQKHLLIKPIREKEIAISLYFLNYYPSRIICWIAKYSENFDNDQKAKHPN
jgi:hypothetical protein